MNNPCYQEVSLKELRTGRNNDHVNLDLSLEFINILVEEKINAKNLRNMIL